MAESLPPLTATGKAGRYREAAEQIAAVVEGEPNRIARMATVVALLRQAFDHYFWAGFYLVDAERPRELVIGPYQGTLGCLRIPFDRGVCGAAARTGQTQVVPDVDAFPGHIACDSRSRSEIVTPVFDAAGQLIAVFDVDALELAAFDETDAVALERIMAEAFGR